MIGDWLETMVDRKGFEARVYPLSQTTFEIAGNNAAAMTALLLRRRRGTPTLGTNVVRRCRRSRNSTLC